MNFDAINEVLGYSKIPNYFLRERLRHISDRVKLKPGEDGFKKAVLDAEADVLAIGNSIIASFVGVITAPPKEREYKIKRSDKGTRIGKLSPSGKNFSFGTVWCNAVKLGKGIVLIEGNREKLNMHGDHVGVPSPETMTARELCKAIAEKL